MNWEKGKRSEQAQLFRLPAAAGGLPDHRLRQFPQEGRELRRGGEVSSSRPGEAHKEEPPLLFRIRRRPGDSGASLRRRDPPGTPQGIPNPWHRGASSGALRRRPSVCRMPARRSASWPRTRASQRLSKSSWNTAVFRRRSRAGEVPYCSSHCSTSFRGVSVRTRGEPDLRPDPASFPECRRPRTASCRPPTQQCPSFGRASGPSG